MGSFDRPNNTHANTYNNAYTFSTNGSNDRANASTNISTYASANTSTNASVNDNRVLTLIRGILEEYGTSDICWRVLLPMKPVVVVLSWGQGDSLPFH